MARVFNDANISAKTITGEDTQVDRESALNDLEKGLLTIVFSVDLFNEGVDVPSVDTLSRFDRRIAPHCSCNSWAGDCAGTTVKLTAWCWTLLVSTVKSFGLIAD